MCVRGGDVCELRVFDMCEFKMHVSEIGCHRQLTQISTKLVSLS